MAGFAWVTLATNDSYSLGALVLAHSLRRVGSKHDLAVLVTPGVTGAMREKLASVYSLVQEVNVLDSKDEANLALLARPELGITFTKLHCWRLTQYEKCVFIDADTLVIRNCDELFEREELSAAPDVGWPDCFNSGVFVFKPSQQTFASITAFAAAKGSFDGGDQGLLNQYFSDWACKDISKHLPFIYNMCSTATYSYLPAFKQFGKDVRIIHFIGITKPWLQYFDTVTGQVQPAPGSNHLQPLLQLWWQIFCENVHPQLSPVMASSTLASIRHEFNPFPSRSSIPTLHEANKFPRDDFQSTEPDFSEFNDPWDNYDVESSKEFSDKEITLIVSSTNDCYKKSDDNFTNDFAFNQNIDDYNRERSPPLHFIIDSKFQSQNNNSNSEKNYEHAFPSLLDNCRINETQDNEQINRDCTFENRNQERHSHERQCNHEIHSETKNSSTCDENRGENYDNKDFYCESYYKEKNDDNHVNSQNRHDCHVKNEYSDDNRQYFEDVRQELDDYSFDKINHRQDDHNHEEENISQNYHNHKRDDSKKNQTLLDREDSRNRVELESFENKFANEEKNLPTEDDDSPNFRCTPEHREKQTDLCTEKSCSNTTWKNTSSSPSEPFSNSKILATQSEPNIAGQLESNDAGIAGALAKLTLGEARSPEQVAFEEHMRKQSWEQGQIDYMGRDSFDNIWKKISETLGVQPTRNSSPTKTTPKPEEIEANVAAAVVIEDEPTAQKSEAALPAEPRRKLDQDLIVELESRQITGEMKIPVQSSSNDAALNPVALANIDSQFPATEIVESIRKTDGEDSILVETMTTLDCSISPGDENILREIDVDTIAKTDSPKISEAAGAASAATAVASIFSEESKMASEKSAKVDQTKQSDSPSSEITSDTHVPIQVAESVLEPEVKESVTENLRPVTEEAISSISVSTGEIVPAVLETTTQAICPSSSTSAAILDAISEIGNGIDALNLSSPLNGDVSNGVVVSQELPAMATSVVTEEIRLPTVSTTSETLASVLRYETAALPVRTIDEPAVVRETRQSSPVVGEIVEKTEVPTEMERLSLCKVESVTKPTGSEDKTEQSSFSFMQTASKTDADSADASKKPDSSASSVKDLEKSQISLDTTKSSSIPAKTNKKLDESKIPKDSAKSTSRLTEESKISPKIDEPIQTPIAIVPESKETEITSKTIKPTTSTVSKLEKIEPSSKSETKTAEVPIKIQEEKSASATIQPIVESIVISRTELPLGEKVSKIDLEKTDISDKIDSQAETSEESPTRPARTKDLQIPGTPTITEATPPTSPPIGAVQSFDAQPPKITKKVVKKIVKKVTATDSKPTEATEVEGETKKITKKVVKKIVKKTKLDDTAAAAASASANVATSGGETSSANEKPKKVVKVPKKTTKSGQTLEADANVPETPPPGTNEIPVPPKRKLKTIGKSAPAKSDSEP